MNKQHKTNLTNNTKQQQTHTCFVLCFVMFVMLVINLSRNMRHSWKQEKRNTKQTQTNDHATQKQTAQSTTSNNTHFFFSVCLLRSLLTYKGTGGIVGNKKNKTKQTPTHEHTTQNQTAQTTTRNNNIILAICFVICYVCYVRY